VNVDRLRKSLEAKHGVLLAPNHCRDEDPFVLNILSAQAHTPLFIMASWHVFMQNKKQAFLLNRAGAFSVYREGILPDMTKGDLDEAESERRWKDLADLYLAQQLFHYPPNYLQSNPTPERILETLERLEEDLTDQITLHGEIHATITVGEAIEVSPDRPRGMADPLMGQVHEQLVTMLGIKS
jgi:hypothetical protein